MGLIYFPLLLMCGLAGVASDVTSVNEVTDTPSADSTANVNGEPQHALPDRVLSDKLYEKVATSNYDDAVTQALDLIRTGRAGVIKQAVDLLIKHSRTNVAGFAYKLWAAGSIDIVETYFPSVYKMTFNDTYVKFLNYRDRSGITYGPILPFDTDKGVYGDNIDLSGNNYVWKLEPAIDGDRVYFKIHHITEFRYLKLGNSVDSDGDYRAYGSTNSDTDRHLWLLQPVNYKGELLFFIINREHNQALKLSRDVVHEERRIAYGHAGTFVESPELYGWHIKIVKPDL